MIATSLIWEEPWVDVDLKKKMSKKQNKYQAYSPKEDWEERPRVITYVRRNGFHRYIKKRQDQLGINQCTPDIVLLQMRLEKEIEQI